MTPQGPVPIEDIRVGDEILALDSDSRPVYSPVILFLDRDPSVQRIFFKVITSSGKTITLTPSHLIYVIDQHDPNDMSKSLATKRVQFAYQINPKQFVVTQELDSTSDEIITRIEEIVSIEVDKRTGVYAPLTREGNLIVNNVLASCYANIEDQSLAHLSFLPVRAYSYLMEFFDLFNSQDHVMRRRQDPPPNGIHWYPRMLRFIGHILLGSYLE